MNEVPAMNESAERTHLSTSDDFAAGVAYADRGFRAPTISDKEERHAERDERGEKRRRC